MTPTLDQILEAARIGETTDWEFKSARGGFPGSFWETYSAMANSEGGVIVLGIRERAEGVNLDGLLPEQIARYQKTLWDGLNNRGIVSLNLLEAHHVEVLEIAGSSLLTIHVPRAARMQRPVYLGGNPLGRTFRRRHEGDYRCTDAEVRRMLSDADPEPVDHRVLPGFGLDDLDPTSLAQYRQRLRTVKGEHPWAGLEDHEMLERLGGWVRQRAKPSEGLTLAGLLMFGKDVAIRHPEAAPAYFIDYREKLDPSTRWSDRIYPDGMWEANLFQFYYRVWPKLAAGLPTPFQLEGGIRRDTTPAHEALREAFVNALIHADYFGAGGIVIERYPDQFVVENPGVLLVSLEQYLRGGISECRNRALQQMFLMIGGGERAGSGADKIRSGWSAQHWRAPKIEPRDQPDRVRLTLPMVSLIPVETLERLRHDLGRQVDALAPAELQALATADVEGTVSNVRLQELLPDHPVDITRMLGRLRERGLLISDHRRRWTTYRLGGGPIQHDLFSDIHLPRSKTHISGESIGKQPDMVGKQPDMVGTQPDMVGTSNGSLDFRPPALTQITRDEAGLRLLAEPVAKAHRAATALVRSIITELCRGRFLSAEQLASLLNRNTRHLRLHFLAPMVREGLLLLRYPEAPKRPGQAYTTAPDR